jgi:hypothetical protein
VTGPEEKPTKPGEMLLGVGCLGVIAALVVLFFVKGNQYFNPRRAESFKPPVRETKTSDEERVRERIETTCHSAAFTSTRRPSEETPPERLAPEPRPGVSVYTLCNDTSGTRVLYLDGVEIFSVEVPSRGSASLEVRSGEYDLMIMGKVGETPPGETPTVVVPTYRRASFSGVHHTLVAESEPPPGFDCRRGHADPVRRVP